MNRALGAVGAGLLLAVAVVACGGGGGSSVGTLVGGGTAAPPNTTVPNATATGGTATLSLLIPSAATTSSKRRAAYISAATKSVAVFAYPSAASPPPTATTVVNVGAGLPGCTSVAAGTSCTITVPAQYGSMTFAISTYDNVLATGDLLSQATFMQTIGPNQAPIPVTLGGVVASVRFSVPQFSFPAGGGTFALTVNALDASGAIIAGGGTYTEPIYLGANDPSVTFSPDPVTGPGQAVTVTYSAAAPATVTIASKVAGLPLAAEGASDISFSAAAAVNYTAWVFDRSQSEAIAFPAGASGNAPAQSHYYTTTGFPTAMSVSPTTGAVAVADYDASEVTIYSAGAAPVVLTFGPYQLVGVAYDPSGNLAVLRVPATGGAGLLSYYAPGPSQTPYANIVLNAGLCCGGAAFSGASLLGIDGTGNVYVEQPAPFAILKFAPSPASTTIPASSATAIAVSPPANTLFDAFAVAPDGTLALLYGGAGNLPNGNSTGVIQIYSPAGSPIHTLSGGVLTEYGGGGIAFSPASGDDTLYYDAGKAVNVFAPTADGTSPPSRVFYSTNANANALALMALGPPIAQATPAAASISGDMLAAAPNRTWNYSVAAPGVPTGTLSVYNDPSPDAAGATGLVGFILADAVADNALPADGGVLFGAVGVQNESDGYHALSFGSVSNDSFGLVPGAPLIAPTTLTLGETFIPYPGVDAHVDFIGAVTGIAGCTGISPAPTIGAQVEYHVAGAAETISYVPGCGITHLGNGAGGSFTLTSIESHPEVGQQSVVRRVLHASYGDTLRAFWQQVIDGKRAGM